MVVWTSVFLVHALTYLFLIPAWQAPDEPTSVELLLTIQARNRLVTPGDSIPEIQREIIASMERNRFWEFGGYGGRPLSDDDRNFHAIWSCCDTQLNRPPLYQLLLLPAAKLTPRWSIERRLWLLRFLTVLLGAITVAVVVRIACDLGELHPAIPWIFPAFVALSPQFAYSSATFNADNLAALLGALLFWRLLRALRYGITARSLAELALLVVLGFGTKRTFLLAVPAVLLALAWQAIAAYRAQHKDQRLKLPLAFGGGIAAVLILVASVSAVRARVSNLVWRYVFNNAPATRLNVLQQVTDQNLTIESWIQRNVVFLNLSFWGSYGWHTVQIAPLIGQLLLFLIVASWLSAVMWLLWKREALPSWGVRFLWVGVFGGITAVLLTVIGTPPEVLPQGRYLFPVMVPIFLLTTIGICGWLPRHRALLGAAVVSGLLALDLYSIVAVVIPAFLR
jgi:hypothetical protein